jgi:hypothetical protein
MEDTSIIEINWLTFFCIRLKSRLLYSIFGPKKKPDVRKKNGTAQRENNLKLDTYS